MSNQKTIQIQLNRLAEQVGNFIQYWGFKKIHGQIWTHIYLSAEPLSAVQLVERLRVSKALVSLSMNDLIKYQLLIQTLESKDKKTKYYTANPNVFEVIRFVLETRELHLLNRISGEHQLLSELKQDRKVDFVDENKLLQLGQMISGAEAALGSLMQLTAVDIDFFQTFSSNDR